MSFEKQSFLVVGGAKRGSIGLELIKKLFSIGVEKVAIFDICDASDVITELKTLFPTKAILFLKVDVRNKVEIENAYKQVVNAFGYVDVLANFAGILDESKPQDVIEINLLGVIYATLVGIDQMSIEKGGRGGTIVNMASICGLDEFFWAPSYCASKHGVVAFTKSLAEKELSAELGIKFIVICPGFTATSLLAEVQPRLYGKNVETEMPKIMEKYGIQTVDQCVNSLVEVLKKAENGSTWILSNGDNKLVDFQFYYKEK
ncbi:alcohol dehydrogenase 1-like [Contarinia nasturtii]|uniref:alcohol dehydrogenase 1-like n=1 Tax=Contarinia nasturtii TaxID=265458 RepID=UPI0012D464EA|nr:alcohol dehydrogenase 1-like [Contarinia nasturtii]